MSEFASASVIFRNCTVLNPNSGLSMHTLYTSRLHVISDEVNIWNSVIHLECIYLAFKIFFSHHFQYPSSLSKEGGFWIVQECYHWGSFTSVALPISDHNLNPHSLAKMATNFNFIANIFFFIQDDVTALLIRGRPDAIFLHVLKSQ